MFFSPLVLSSKMSKPGHAVIMPNRIAVTCVSQGQACGVYVNVCVCVLGGDSGVCCSWQT